MISVLYVDDEPDLCAASSRLLSQKGFVVDTCTSVEDAFLVLHKKTYDVIVSDYLMPRMNGIDFLVEVRKNYGDLPFIIFTGKGDEDVVLRAIEYKADSYVRKNCDLKTLLTDLAFTIENVVEKYQAKKNLEHSLKKLRHAEEIAGFGHWEYHPDTGMVLLSHGTQNICGLSGDEWPYTEFLSFAPPELEQKISYLFHTLITKGEPFNVSYQIHRKTDGKIIYVQSLAEYDIDANVVFGVMHDVTEQYIAQQALLESEEKYRFLVTNALEPILIVDMQGSILFANSAALKLIEGDEIFSFIGRNVIEFIAPVSQKDVIRDFVEVSQGHDAYVAEYDVITAKGRRVTVESIGKAIRYEGKKADLLSLRDITDRKQAQEALRRSEEQFRSFVEHANDVVYSLSKEGLFIYISPNWTEFLGHVPEEVIGHSFTEFVHPDDLPVCTSFFYLVTHTEKKGSGVEFRARHKDGVWKWFSSTASMIHDVNTGNLVYLGIAHDISERKKTEEALRKASNQINLMNSITRHDILNKVTVILGAIEVAELECLVPEISHYFDIIENATVAIQRQIEFTREYQDLGIHEPFWQNPEQIIGNLQVPKNVTIENHVHHVSIFADPMLEKVFYNLLDNSLRHGKNVTHILVTGTDRPDGFMLSWEDDGVGVGVEEKELIFERGHGANTGLGLFLVREILALTGISIHETGKKGSGARFDMCIPKGAYSVTI